LLAVFARLSRDSLFEGFVRYLALRVADQQQIVANLVTVDSEQRLGQTLLHLARTMGKKDPLTWRKSPSGPVPLGELAIFLFEGIQ
jgi:hypothetical protein